MKVIPLFRGVIISLLLGAWAHAETPAQAPEDDPFAAKPEPKEDPDAWKPFMTTGEYKVTPLLKGSFNDVAEEDRPKIEHPIRFNRYFDSPLWMKKIDGGYFASYDAGEWGGALFYTLGKDTQWTRLIDAHIHGLGVFSSSAFLAVGGLAHMGPSQGAVYLIKQTAQGGWKTRKVFQSKIGVPILIGTSKTAPDERVGSKQLFVIGLEYPKAGEPLMGVDEVGVVYYLGERVKAKEKEEK